jgi:hypothetical protein
MRGRIEAEERLHQLGELVLGIGDRVADGLFVESESMAPGVA